MSRPESLSRDYEDLLQGVLEYEDLRVDSPETAAEYFNQLRKSFDRRGHDTRAFGILCGWVYGDIKGMRTELDDGPEGLV